MWNSLECESRYKAKNWANNHSLSYHKNKYVNFLCLHKRLPFCKIKYTLSEELSAHDIKWLSFLTWEQKG